ncbi:3',5'-cyclic-nucleotide phosphodiesterase [Hymenobacter sp. RP-2-7]|uniref:3',5'-cyclic-nucleotide phosphodiesterase n=1 Tax=Hymenobacter polaris TaxID=2682546 RepID=A0A7Y0AAH4_9BACT|nr:3',5'-cyclic-nucleotide phosphodiesterase [Hymenobacter polaris]NML63587.1 3',5'-cyclic-nucleotide phosphodiesterase [Hymenobacter polaris]
MRQFNNRIWVGLRLLGLAAGLLAARPAGAQSAAAPAFAVVPLGVRGGLDESNLSAYLVAPAGSAAYVCLDAGSLRTGLEKALASRALAGPGPEAVLRQQVCAYLLSHAHLDHVAGLLLNAPDDSSKPIYGLASCLKTLQNDYFNWRAWPNFGNGGAAPALGKYQLLPLAPGPALGIPGTALRVRAFPLSHGPGYESAAFLLQSGPDYLLYLGDTGADELEHSQHLRTLWQAVAPLVQAGQLRGIFLETSYPNEQPETQLFGHLTPRRLWQELGTLGQLAGPEALRRVPLIITHRKPPANQEAAIARQLAAGNTLGMKLVYPVQGQRLGL